MKRKLCLILACLLMLSLGISTLAAEQGYADVSGDEWYADAVEALQEAGLMNGVGDNRFEPEGIFTRAQLATVLYRLAESPPVSGEDDFSDTVSGAWYSDAVLWASRNGIVNGYGDGRFGPGDATTQEQMAVMLWRSAGSYVLGPEYADAGGAENAASAWAVDGVRWARVDGLLTDAVPFTPKAEASRAQVADMLYRYLQLLERFGDADAVSGATPKAEESGPKVLVAYFSCTGNTEKIALYIAESLGASVFQILPAEPYTAEDLNYYDNSARAMREQSDASARPAISEMPEQPADYDVIFLGYPIWCAQAPKILYTFAESFDLSGKTVVPFCTSGSSGIGSSAANLSACAPEANWVAGSRFSAVASRDAVESWAQGVIAALPAA
jgi:flavodoxin